MTRAECRKEMKKTKQRSAAEYKCVVGCSKRSTYEEAILCSVKCAMDHAGTGKGTGEVGPLQTPVRTAPPAQWSVAMTLSARCT